MSLTHVQSSAKEGNNRVDGSGTLSPAPDLLLHVSTSITHGERPMATPHQEIEEDLIDLCLEWYM